jgi:hypothetical protein
MASWLVTFLLFFQSLFHVLQSDIWLKDLFIVATQIVHGKRIELTKVINMHLILLFQNRFSVFQKLMGLQKVSLTQVLHALLVKLHQVFKDGASIKFLIQIFKLQGLI